MCAEAAASIVVFYMPLQLVFLEYSTNGLDKEAAKVTPARVPPFLQHEAMVEVIHRFSRLLQIS